VRVGPRRDLRGGLLTVRCTGGGYLYTAGRPGAAAISATVWPRCSPGQMCPQWVTEPTLHLTITGTAGEAGSGEATWDGSGRGF
jgi:hypothetical protein